MSLITDLCESIQKMSDDVWRKRNDQWRKRHGEGQLLAQVGEPFIDNLNEMINDELWAGVENGESGRCNPSPPKEDNVDFIEADEQDICIDWTAMINNITNNGEKINNGELDKIEETDNIDQDEGCANWHSVHHKFN